MKQNTGKHNNKLAGLYIVARFYLLLAITFSITVHAEDVSQTAPEESAISAAIAPDVVATSEAITTPEAITTSEVITTPETMTAAESAAALATDDAVAPSAIATTSPVTAHKPAVTGSVKKSTTSQLANLVGGLALILLLIYGLSWFVKRFGQGGFMKNSTIKMLSTMPLGTRERLMLVDVGGKQMLLGVTAGNINMLHVFAEPVVDSNEKNNQTQTAANPASEFSQKLMAILQQKGSSTTSPEHKNIKE